MYTWKIFIIEIVFNIWAYLSSVLHIAEAEEGKIDVFGDDDDFEEFGINPGDFIFTFSISKIIFIDSLSPAPSSPHINHEKLLDFH